MSIISKKTKVENESGLDFRHAFAGIAAVLCANRMSLGFHVYERFPNVDIPLHLAGGFVAGLFAICIRNELLRRKNIKRAPWWFDLLFVVGFAAMVASFWELYEFVLDATNLALGNLDRTQLSVGDTVFDLMNGMIGATFSFWIQGDSTTKTSRSRRTP